MSTAYQLMFPPTATTMQPKSPKSPKTGLENPLLKSSSLCFPAPSLIPEQDRSPESAIPGRNSLQVQATPGPPPKASLSLNLRISSVSKESSFQTPAKYTIPLPIASPQPLFDSQDVDAVQNTDQNNYWVVAFGFTNERESMELMSMLHSFGRIVAKKSNSNWIAVQFQDELTAARASARHLVRIGFILCGISRTNVNSLEEIVGRSIGLNMNSLKETQTGDLVEYHKSPSLEEQDILAGHNNRVGTTSGREKSKSFCEKLFYWYFGWDANPNKMHMD